MILIKIAVLVILWRICPKLINNIMKTTSLILNKCNYAFTRIYRTLNVKKSQRYVWKELIKFHKTAGWKFGQFENEKSIECTFKVDDTNYLDFNYVVTPENIVFKSTILQRFDEELTNDILVLASHFNGLLNFGIVKVSLKYNYVEFQYSRDLLAYSLYPGELYSDTELHFKLTKDIFWSFTNLIETGDDPVFVFSELMRRREERNKENG